MKSINTASTALIIAERDLCDGVDRVKNYGRVCTGEMYGSLSRTIKDIAKTNHIEIADSDPCHQCGNHINEPYMYVKEFCSQKHLDEFTTSIEDNENGIQSIMLGEEDAIRENALMRIALHKLMVMTLPDNASFVVNEVLISLSKDYGVA
jgi:hypothetical protein